MTRAKFYEEIYKLAYTEYDASKCDFPKHLKSILNSYLEKLGELDVTERPNDWANITNENKKLIDAINECVECYYDGRHSEAFNHLKDKINLDRYKVELTKFNTDYYRMRVFKDNEKRDYKGMFHIPFNMRTKVSTQRYSAPGYPCLYLGKSAYVCWEEMHKPNLDKCYVSMFRLVSTKNSIKVFDLSLPYYIFPNEETPLWEIDENFAFDIYKLPLVIACMVKVANPDDPFKPEYIIPQFLMELVIEKKDFKGIVYTSVHKSDGFNFDLDKSLNFVFPAFMSHDEKKKYSESLCEMFRLTEPTCDELERAICPYQAIQAANTNIDSLIKSIKYRISTFGQLEARLNDGNRFPLKEIKNEDMK